MQIVHYSPDRAKEVASLFTQAVHAIDSSIYDEVEKQAWAPVEIDYSKWKERLAKTKPYLLLNGGEVAGFIELEDNGHIDCTYVLPIYQRQGVATRLLQHVITSAKKSQLSILTVESSIVAKPFFENAGFVVKNQNRVERHGVILINYSMFMVLP
jgi:putative acetyltransferase